MCCSLGPMLFRSRMTKLSVAWRHQLFPLFNLLTDWIAQVKQLFKLIGLS